MKPQDILFFVILAGLIFFRKSNYIVIAGLICLFLAIPLFIRHIFFTAQHLTYYGVGFFLVAAIFKLVELREE